MVSERYPRIRLTLPDGRLALREGLALCFYMRRPHGALSSAVTRALDHYLDAVGHEKLGWYVDMGGDIDPSERKGWAGNIRPLDTRLWTRVREELRDPSGCILQLEEHPDQAGGFRFEYHGRSHEDLALPGFVSAVSFWLPTETLEQEGPEHIKTLAVALARELPFDSGHAGLAFNARIPSGQTLPLLRKLSARHPGLDVQELGTTSMYLGEKVRGPCWLNFYGPSLLGQLGGVEGLRARLPLPEISVEELSAQGALVSLGNGPEAGDLERGIELKPHHALFRVLEPFLDEGPPDAPDAARRWHRRFSR